MSWYRVGNAYARVPPKNGSTSFKFAVSGCTSSARLNAYAVNYSLGPYDTPPDDGLPRYISIREPVDRFESLWRCCQRETYHNESFVIQWGLQGCTPEFLMSVIETCFNPHWQRQSALMCPGAIPIPYDRFMAVMGLPVAFENVTKPMACHSPELRIQAYYKDDFPLWERAQHQALELI